MGHSQSLHRQEHDDSSNHHHHHQDQSSFSTDERPLDSSGTATTTGPSRRIGEATTESASVSHATESSPSMIERRRSYNDSVTPSSSSTGGGVVAFGGDGDTRSSNSHTGSAASRLTSQSSQQQQEQEPSSTPQRRVLAGLRAMSARHLRSSSNNNNNNSSNNNNNTTSTTTTATASLRPGALARFRSGRSSRARSADSSRVGSPSTDQVPSLTSRRRRRENAIEAAQDIQMQDEPSSPRSRSMEEPPSLLSMEDADADADDDNDNDDDGPPSLMSMEEPHPHASSRPPRPYPRTPPRNANVPSPASNAGTTTTYVMMPPDDSDTFPTTPVQPPAPLPALQPTTTALRDQRQQQQQYQNQAHLTSHAVYETPPRSSSSVINPTSTSHPHTVSFDSPVTASVGLVAPLLHYQNARQQALFNSRRSSGCSYETGSTISDEMDEEENNEEFYPVPSRNNEWMGRSLESLLLGHTARAPILQLSDDDLSLDPDASVTDFMRRRSTTSTFGEGRRRSSQGSFAGIGRRGSLSLSYSSRDGMRGGTLAYYYARQRRQMPSDVDRSSSASVGTAMANNVTGSSNGVSSDRQGRRGSTTSAAQGPMFRRRSSVASSIGGTMMEDPSNTARAGGALPRPGGPNVLLSVMARESTGKSCFARGIPVSQCLRTMGGSTLYSALDKPAAGMASEVAFLAAAIDTGDWSETHTIVSRLIQRLIGDPTGAVLQDGGGGSTRRSIQDPNLPPTAPRYYAGGGRLGLERDAFVQAGGVEVLIRMFREKSFVGQEMASSYDARDLSEEIVQTRLAPCWNEALAALRELVYFIPALVDEGTVSDRGDFLPFLFTLLSHDSCFDGAAALIEEILSFMSQTQPQVSAADAAAASNGGAGGEGTPMVMTRVPPATTFFLGNVPDLYKLWRGFNCRQLAHFCRILALLVFEPEDRQLLESPAVLKSLELLQLRRNRATRAGRDSTVDMNQAILLGDEELLKRLLQLLSVMNYAPPLRRFSPYHVMAHFPFIADTLVMLGLGELDNWEEMNRQERLARRLIAEAASSAAAEGRTSTTEPVLNELGTVADMLEGLSETLMGNNNNNRQAPNQIGHIIHVISAAQQAGVIVGRNRWRQRGRNSAEAPAQRGSVGDGNGGIQEDVDGEMLRGPAAAAAAAVAMDGRVDPTAMQGLASVAGILTDQIFVRRIYQGGAQDYDDGSGDGTVPMLGMTGDTGEVRHLINTPEDAANSLQFNAMLLGPYQVEVLFVLCTLLGGRRKLDAQDMLNRLGLVPVLEDMFQRLPWYKGESQSSNNDNEPSSAERDPGQQPNGIHGPGCECTPESALCVQYLRLLHNFCDRDCDNYPGRRLLLSEDEREWVFGGRMRHARLRPGLLSKIVDAFVRESDESSYRFWLASCIESYLRGSSPGEQMFAAESGLLQHLIDDISSERLHCAGSLQTSFDLLGELSKGNSEVVRLLVSQLDEERFRKLMSVAAANLVDSNVFIRSLLLSLERLSAREGSMPLYMDATAPGMQPKEWVSQRGSSSRAYLTHSWWDAPSISLLSSAPEELEEDQQTHESRPSDWFPTQEMVSMNFVETPDVSVLASGLTESVGHFGWVFTPAGEGLAAETYLPNTVERLSWFLAANQARLLRDLLGVVDLASLSHETICCLNTAVVIAIFAHRRRQLAELLQELRQMNDEEKESKRRALTASRQDDVVDRAFVQAMQYLDINGSRDSPPYARRASMSVHNSGQQIGDRTDVMRNFREVLWFWMEYYTHRGRDRLSLEFSSHIRFQEWNHVVSLLAADDGSATSLVCAPVRLPRSPYQRSPRVADNPIRGV